MWFNIILAAINGSDFINNPWNTTFGPYTDLLGAGFYLVPICFIAAALYVKTHNGVAVGTFLWVSGILLSSGSIFLNYPQMGFLFLIFTVVSMIGTFLAIYFNKKFHW